MLGRWVCLCLKGKDQGVEGGGGGGGRDPTPTSCTSWPFMSSFVRTAWWAVGAPMGNQTIVNGRGRGGEGGIGWWWWLFVVKRGRERKRVGSFWSHHYIISPVGPVWILGLHRTVQVVVVQDCLFLHYFPKRVCKRCRIRLIVLEFRSYVYIRFADSNVEFFFFWVDMWLYVFWTVLILKTYGFVL